MAPFFISLTILRLLCVCVCVCACVRVFACMRGWHAGKKKIGYAYDLSDVFQSHQLY